MFDYFTKDKHLHNLLWVYGASSTGNAPPDLYYPGDSYCDIVGLDCYADAINLRGYRE